MPTMRALQIHRLGGPEVLELAQLPVPEAGPGQVRLKVEAVGINFADILTVRGEYLTRTRLPMTPGMEFAGLVDALGEGVDGPKVGTRVAALGGSGGLAEYATVPVGAVVPVPEGLSAPEAAAFPVSFFTAYFALVTLGQAKPGETVLVQAAAGALGTASIQLARALELKVIATASSEEKLAVARDLGADHTLLSNRENLVDAVKQASGGGVNILLEVVGGPGFQDSLAMLAFRGRVLVIGAASQEASTLRPVELMKKNLSVTGVWLTSMLGDAAAMQGAGAALGGLLATGQLRPQVGRTFALEQTGEAFEFILSRKSTGKVVVTP